MLRILKLLLLLLPLWAGALSAQEVVYEIYDNTSLNVIIPYSQIKFRSNADFARYELTMEVKSQETRRIWNFDQTIGVPRRDWLSGSAILSRFMAELPPGKYQAVLRLRNADLGVKSDVKKAFTVSAAKTEIGQPYLIVRKEGIDFLPPDLNSIPRPVEKTWIHQQYSLDLQQVLITVDEEEYLVESGQGSYIFDLTDMANTRNINKIEIRLSEGNIVYKMDVFHYDQWFSYNLRYSYQDQIRQLRYIANQNEWRSINATPEEKATEMIELFWQRRDPTPGTLRNETREEFYRRVIMADERFTVHKRLQGWKSDRGRIYIKYGEPDETYSEVHPLDVSPYIVWTYYDRNLQFVFEDTGGFGQYKLRNKDEEL